MNESLPLLDLSQPFLMEPRAARYYVQVYQQVLQRKALGLDITTPAQLDRPSTATVPSAVAAQDGTYLKEEYYWTARNGVAKIDVRGPIVRYGGMLRAYSGLASTGNIAIAINQALDAKEIHTIAMNFDSPGGEGNGIGELGKQIRMADQVKPVVAYVDGVCCSAAAWLAAACRETVVSETAILGSIGAIIVYHDMTKALERMGIEELEFISSQAPLKSPKPLSSDPKAAKQGREYFQNLVNQFGEIFARAMAEYRGVSLDTVYNDFGQGGVMLGEQAVSVGLADRLGDWESFHAELSAGAGKTPARKRQLNSGGISMNSDNAAVQAAANGGAPGGFMAWLQGIYASAQGTAPANNEAPANGDNSGTPPGASLQNQAPATPPANAGVPPEIATRLAALEQTNATLQTQLAAQAEEGRRQAEAAQAQARGTFMASIRRNIPASVSAQVDQLYALCQRLDGSPEPLIMRAVTKDGTTVQERVQPTTLMAEIFTGLGESVMFQDFGGADWGSEGTDLDPADPVLPPAAEGDADLQAIAAQARAYAQSANGGPNAVQSSSVMVSTQ